MQSNTNKNIQSIAYIICLLCLEFGEEDNVVDLVGFILGIQNLARNKDTKLSFSQQSAIHSTVVLFFLLLSDLTTISSIYQHLNQVLRRREEQAMFLLPTFAFSTEYETHQQIQQTVSDDSLYFDHHTVVMALKNNNYDTTSIETPYIPRPAAIRTLSAASINEHFPLTKADSQQSIISTVSKMDAVAVPKITYEDLKDALRGDNKAMKKEEVLDFEKSTFKEICMHNEKKTQELEFVIKKSLDIALRTVQANKNVELQKDIFQIDFPAFFVY